ncbi:MAG: hypothetical protein IJS15_15135 [Victivallales bacterium]|nr:hypothetical protein [Victivallales bacterium]
MKWIWNRIGMMLPDGWEMLQFSRNPSQGRCVFADRYQFRLELDWMTVSVPPDMERMSSDYTARLKENGLQSVEKVSHHPWSGAYGLEHGRPVSRYGAYFPDGPYLLEAVFIGESGDKPNHAAECRILDSFKVNPESATSRWCAFGMDWYTSATDFALCYVAPGLAEASFTDGKKHISQTFSRRGMLKTWLKKPVTEWLASTVPSEYKTVSLEHESTDGHDVWTLVARRRHAVLSDWIHGRRHIKASAWICPRDGRLYAMSTLAHCDGRQFPPASLGCCGFKVDNSVDAK